MKKKFPKLRNIEVYEHLDFHLEKTNYADRLLWLKQANAFARAAQKAKLIKPK